MLEALTYANLRHTMNEIRTYVEWSGTVITTTPKHDKFGAIYLVRTQNFPEN